MILYIRVFRFNMISETAKIVSKMNKPNIAAVIVAHSANTAPPEAKRGHGRAMLPPSEKVNRRRNPTIIVLIAKEELL